MTERVIGNLFTRVWWGLLSSLMFEGCGLYYNVGKGVVKKQRVGKEYNLQIKVYMVEWVIGNLFTSNL